MKELLNVAGLESMEELEKIQLQKRIEFWNGRRLPEAEIVRPSYSR
jgi:hypothetical protein